MPEVWAQTPAADAGVAVGRAAGAGVGAAEAGERGRRGMPWSGPCDSFWIRMMMTCGLMPHALPR